MVDQKEFSFNDITPFKVGTMVGIPIVVKIVSDEVRRAIDLLSIKDAVLEDIANKTYLLIPGNAPLIISEKYIEDIKQWCISFGDGKRVTYKLRDGALKYILSYTH